MITVKQLIERLQECATPDKTPVVLSLEGEQLPVATAALQDEVLVLELDEEAWIKLRTEMETDW